MDSSGLALRQKVLIGAEVPVWDTRGRSYASHFTPLPLVLRVTITHHTASFRHHQHPIILTPVKCCLDLWVKGHG